MTELIKVTEENGNKLVSARELHEFLESKQDFTTWIKGRIDKYGFIENEDFTLHKFMVGKSVAHNYILKMDMAKELSMVENNDKGRQARKYFIEVQNKYEKTIIKLENVEFKGNIEGLVYSKNGVPVTTSKIIAEFTKKEHKNVTRDIRQEIKNIKNISSNMNTSNDIKLMLSDFKENKYLDVYGREQIIYELGERATMQILLKYSTEARLKFISSFMDIKNSMMNMFKAKVLEEVLPQDNRFRQYVYIIENIDTGRIKIGVGNNPEKRLKQLQTGSDSELELVYRSNLCSNAFEVEKFMHSNFENNHVRGEWYSVDKTLVINELEKNKFILKSEFKKILDGENPIFKY